MDTIECLFPLPPNAMQSDGKACTICKCVKPYTCFHNNRSAIDGLNPHCKQCRSDADKARAAKNRSINERVSSEERRRVASFFAAKKKCCTCKLSLDMDEFYNNVRTKDGLFIRCIMCCLISGAKSRSAQSGVPFSLNYLDIRLPRVCEVFNKPFDLGGTGVTPMSPSIDRIDPRLGYVRPNVRVISKLANIIKSNVIDPTVLEQVVAYMRRNGL